MSSDPRKLKAPFTVEKPIKSHTKFLFLNMILRDSLNGVF